VRDIQPVAGSEASTVPDHERAFSNHIWKVSAATGGYLLDTHGNLEFSGTVLAAYPIFVRVIHFIGVRSLGDVRSLGHSAIFGTELARALATDQSTSVTQSWTQRYPRFLTCPWTGHRSKYQRNAVLDTAPPS
jgi:hypothetical protein